MSHRLFFESKGRLLIITSADARHLVKGKITTWTPGWNVVHDIQARLAADAAIKARRRKFALNLAAVIPAGYLYGKYSKQPMSRSQWPYGRAPTPLWVTAEAKQAMSKRRGGYYRRKRAGRAYWGTVIPARNRGYTRTKGFYGRFRGHTHRAPEMKFHDVVANISTISVTGNYLPQLLTITEGVGPSQRIGRKMTVKKFCYRFHLILPVTTVSVDTTDSVRVIAFVDHQTNGAALTASTTILESADIDSWRNLINSGRFTIFADKVYDLSSASGANAAGNYGSVEIFDTIYKDLNTVIEYDAGGTGDITEIRTNNIGVLFLSRRGTAFVEGRVRIRYQG